MPYNSNSQVAAYKKRKTLKHTTRGRARKAPAINYIGKFINGAMASGNYFKTTLRQKFSLDCDSSGDIGVGTPVYYTNNCSAATDWAACALLFEAYRVVRMCLTYYPRSQATPVASQAFSPMYLCFDEDSNGAGTTYTADQILQMSTCKVFQSDKKWSFMAICKKDSQVTVANARISAGGWIDSQYPLDTQAIYINMLGSTGAITYGDVILEHEVEFRTQR